MGPHAHRRGPTFRPHAGGGDAADLHRQGTRRAAATAAPKRAAAGRRTRVWVQGRDRGHQELDLIVVAAVAATANVDIETKERNKNEQKTTNKYGEPDGKKKKKKQKSVVLCPRLVVRTVGRLV